MNPKSTLYSGLLLACLLSVPALAAPKQESAGQLALKKAQGAVRQLTEEKQALEAEKTALIDQVKKLEGTAQQLGPLQAELVLHKSQEEALHTSNSTLAVQLQGERDKLQNLHNKLKDIVAQAKLIQNDNQLLVAAVKEREQWIGQCRDKNHQLLEVNQALVGKYQDKGFWSKAAELEPFTGIGKVETQNTVESYQFKLADLKVTEFAEAGHAQPAEADAAAPNP
jgi:chromosome segregation ATPase